MFFDYLFTFLVKLKIPSITSLFFKQCEKSAIWSGKFVFLKNGSRVGHYSVCALLTYHLVHEPRRSGVSRGRQHVHPQNYATVGQDFFRRQANLGTGTAAQETRHGGFEVVRRQVSGALFVQLIRDIGPSVVGRFRFVFLQTRNNTIDIQCVILYMYT